MYRLQWTHKLLVLASYYGYLAYLTLHIPACYERSVTYECVIGEA